MADVLVTCIKKAATGNPYDAITHLGGPGGGGWMWTREQVASSIRLGTNSFYTMFSGRRVDIGVINGPNGLYLRTHSDGTWNDNLLALHECPESA